MNIEGLKMTSYLFLGAIAMLYVSFMNEAISATPVNLKCHTPNEEKIFTVGPEKVTFHHEDAFHNGRSISSTGVSARTQNTHIGFTKVLYMNGNKHRIHIQDLRNMNDVHDYMTIVSPKGHTMTYPINCQRI